RSDGTVVRPPGSDRLRPAGGLGGLARGLAAAMGRKHQRTERLPYTWTPYLPMVPARRRTLRRPWHQGHRHRPTRRPKRAVSLVISTGAAAACSAAVRP